MADNPFAGIDRTVADPLDLSNFEPRPLTEEDIRTSWRKAMRYQSPPTEEELVSMLLPRHRLAYFKLRHNERHQFRWLRKELFRRTIG